MIRGLKSLEAQVRRLKREIKKKFPPAPPAPPSPPQASGQATQMIQQDAESQQKAGLGGSGQ